MALAFPVLPMKATMGSPRSVPDGDEWAFEVKWDGYRTVAHVADGRVRLQSTAGHDVTARWPELAEVAGSVNAASAIIDAELVVFGDDGRPSFELVQRSGVGSARQATLQCFDVLQIDGTDTIALPYLDRRRLLDQLVEPGPNWTVPGHHLGNGAALLAATSEQGLEGVIAKHVESTYRPATRSRQWRKIKHRRVVELPIGGFTAGTGNRAGTFGALLVGHPSDEGALRYAGGVGTGFDQSTLFDLTALLRGLATDRCPFDPSPPASVARSATWVEPSLRAVVEIAEFTNDGLVRHAGFLRLVPSSGSGPVGVGASHP